jgi:cyclic pyranopterin phosphate synthase
MVPISSKSVTSRTAIAVCSIHFSNTTTLPLIRSNQLKKGDVLGVARIAGIMAAKRTSELIPLCHPIAITHVGVELDLVDDEGANGKMGCDKREVKGVEGEEGERSSSPWQGTGQGDAYPFHTPASASQVSKTVDEMKMNDFGKVDITATVSCDGKTGVEMEALTAASTAALTVYDMCKAVDKKMRIEGLRVVRKEGGKSGLWVEGSKEEHET